MDEEVWRGLDLPLPANSAADDALHDPFWPLFADCTASFLAGDNSACFGVDITGSASNKQVGMDASCFTAERDALMTQMQHEPVYSSSTSPSSKRSLSIDSGGATATSSSPFSAFALDGADAFAAAAAAFSPSAPAQSDAFAGDDEAIMRAMMAVLSSASPSSSESSSPPRSQAGTSMQQAVAEYLRGGDTSGHVVVRSSCSLAEKTTATNSAGGGGRQQQDGGGNNNNSSQVYHMMSERKRREKLNDSFHTLRSLLPPCSKKDKTTVLINAASYLKKLEAEVSELEEKNAKLERHVPREDGGSATAKLAQAAAHRRAKVQISRAPSDAADQVNLTVMVMVECDIVDLVLHVLERLRWMAGVSVLSVDADTYSPQVLLKAIASIKLQITDGDCWNEALFHEAMTKAVHDATSSPLPCANAAPLVVAA